MSKIAVYSVGAT